MRYILMIATLLTATAAAGGALDELRRNQATPKCVALPWTPVCLVRVDLAPHQSRQVNFPMRHMNCRPGDTHHAVTPPGIVAQFHSSLCTGRVGFYNVTHRRQKGDALIWLEGR